MLLQEVTVIHLMEKFTIVMETKCHLQHRRLPPVFLFISQCNAFSILTAYYLRHCATNGKLAGSIPIGVIGIFH
jgi:hypothetical protein